jgi:HD-like signal output (HDOD) protein
MVSLDYTLNRIKKIDILPTFPDIIEGIICIIEDPMSSASDLAKNMDPSTVGEVMRVANTTYFGTRNFRNISTIEHAIAIIGYDHLSYILLQMPFLTMVNVDDDTFDRIGFVRHSISSGVIAKIISSTIRIANPHEVYISGIVHDIGTIIIYQYFHQAWNTIRSLIHDRKLTRLEAEREVFSVDHGYIGAILLENWNIPKSITEGVMYHHTPGESDLHKNNTLVTHLGNEFSKRIDFDLDFIDFNDFLRRHRDFVGYMTDVGGHFVPSDEVMFFEKVYTILKGVNGYLQGTMEAEKDTHDTCHCC